MLENNRHLLALCVVCGVIGTYFISVYILVLAFVACIYIFISDPKLLGLGVSAVKDFTFPVPSWIKSIISSLMNSYHLSKPLEPEPNCRRSPPYSPNLPIPRRSSCRSGRFSCLDENTDYVNRRNGIGLCSPSTPFNNNYSNSIHSFRRHSGFSDAENSTKMEEFSTPQTSPWSRRQNYSGNEFSSVRRVQTVAGPLLATSALSIRKSNDFGLYVDANSPGLASRIVQYREEGASPGGTVWTHQPQYNSPGQFPMVHLNHSPSSLPVLSPLSSQKASRRSVRVKIAPPDPLGSRLYPLLTKSNTSYSTLQADHSTKSVIETLKEISRKRIHSQLEDQDDDAAKRQKRNAHTDVLTSQGIDDVGEGENVSKRLREESPRHHELSPPARPAKRIRNNEILSSLSSSRKLLQGGSMKRKTHNLDWSRCSTPVLGKQQKTVDDEDDDASSSSHARNTSIKSTPSVTPSMLSQALQKENHKKISQKETRMPSERERSRSNSLSLTRPLSSGKETKRNKSQVTPVTPQSAQKGSGAPVDDSPWQKDSPFVTVSSPDDIIDDISALEEKREEDRRSRLMSMMTVISGGEPPVKMPTTTEDLNAPSSGKSVLTATFVLGNNSLTGPTSTNNLTPSISSEKSLFGSSSLPNSWPSNPSTLTASLAPDNASAVPENIKPASPTATSSGTPLISAPSFTFGTPAPVSSASPALTNNVGTPMSSTPPVTSGSNAPVFGSSAQITTQQSPSESSPLVFGSAQSLFGSKPATSTENVNPFSSQPQVSENSTAPSNSGGNTSFTVASPITFGMPTTSVAQSTNPVPAAVTSTVIPVSSSSTSTFQLRPAVTGIGQESAVSSSSGFGSSAVTGADTSSVQTNIFAKTSAFGASEKPAVSEAPGTIVFGTPVTTSATPSFVFGSTATPTPSSGSQIKSGLFSFGNASTSNPSSQTVTSTSSAKPVFGSSTGAFGQAAAVAAVSSSNVASPGQSINSQAATNKVGGFKFDLSPGKSLFSNQVNVPSGPTANVFGNPTTAAPANSESKPFAFGSAKPMENPFALNASNSTVTSSQVQTSGNLFGSNTNSTVTSSHVQTPGNLFGSNNNSTATSSQVQTPGNIFGSSALQQKQGESDKPKENLFSFGGSSAASPGFSAPQPGSFSAQPTTTTANSGFSFSSATPSGFSQLSSGTGGFSMQANATSTTNFAAPSATTTAANSTFAFGSSTSNQMPQSNMFAFGANSSTSDPQSSNMFAFGSSNNPTTSGGTGMFGQPAAPVAAIQPQAVTAQAPVQAPAAAAATPSAFQFGTSNSSQQLPGSFNFGSSSNTSAPTSGFSSGGSFQINSGGFGGGPAMFSIGSGSTAPRVRSARTRRTK